MTTYSPKLKNPDHPDLVQAVKNGDELPVPTLCYLMEKMRHARVTGRFLLAQQYRSQWEEIADFAIGDKTELSLLYRGKKLLLSRENGQIVWQSSDPS